MSKELIFNNLDLALSLLNDFEGFQKKIYTNLLMLCDKLKNKISTSQYRPIYRLNFIEQIDPDEPQTSFYLRELFNFKDREGSNTILKLFALKFLVPIGFDINKIKIPLIKKEHKHLDLLIKEDGKYAVIIENKLKGAVSQRNQLARYVETLQEEGFDKDNIFIVILPNENISLDSIRKSVWRAPLDWKRPNDLRKCACDKYDCWCDRNNYNEICDIQHCSKCNIEILNDFRNHSVIIHKELADWFIDLEKEIEPREINLRSALLQLGFYLKLLYRTNNNSLLNMEIARFLREQLSVEVNKDSWLKINETLKDLDVLYKNLQNLKIELSSELIDKWYFELIDKWPTLDYKPHISFGLYLKNDIWCGCYFKASGEGMDTGDNWEPFWGFKSLALDNAIQLEQKEMINKILETANMHGKDGGFWIKWDNTLSGSERCDLLFQAALDLGYIQSL